MKNRRLLLLRTLPIILCSLLLSLTAAAAPFQLRKGAPAPPPGTDDKVDIINAVTPKYTIWQSAELSGKLRMQGLPISPTVKIYMRHGEEILLSIRAPFVGELGRIEVKGDSVTAINKLKRVYCKESIAQIRQDYPQIIADAQSWLLGRVVLVTEGELSSSNIETVQIERIQPDTNPRTWKLSFPKPDITSDYSYSYLLNANGEVEKIDVNLDSKGMALTMDCDNKPFGRDLDISFTKGANTKIKAVLQLDGTQWDAIAPTPLNITSSYTRIPLKQFLKSF